MYKEEWIKQDKINNSKIKKMNGWMLKINKIEFI